MLNIIEMLLEITAMLAGLCVTSNNESRFKRFKRNRKKLKRPLPGPWLHMDPENPIA